MTGDNPIYIEMNKEPRKHGVNYEYALEHGESKAKAIFMFAISLPKLLLFMPNWFALLTPFKHKWPEEVHKWTGERCDWH
ncbi:hypothetical protein [Marinomonas sp.]|uniref:hypothetical protein n=1 Tax=Marinomonas sp. TaxID=1904862 RepID=UPI003BA86087